MHAQVFKCFKNDDLIETVPYAVKYTRETDEEKKLAHLKEFNITKSLEHENVVRSIELFDSEIKGEIH